MTVEIAALAAELASIAVRNTASAVFTRVKAIRTGKQHAEQVNELNAIINELVDDRNQLIAIAQAFEQELVAQRISDDDITYITDKLIPAAERLMQLGGNSPDAQMAEALELLKTVVSVEMLTVMQLVGFNFKRAVGEPLTRLVESLIDKLKRADESQDITILGLKREIEILQIAQDESSVKRLQQLYGGGSA